MNSSSPQVLQNADPAAGIPLTVQDGLITGQAGAPQQVTLVNLATEAAVFDNQNDGTNGPLFYSENGTVASLNGSVGPDTIVNQVLLAQITTDGTFSFALNIQIGTPLGLTENYVAANPTGSEIFASFLTYSSTVDIQELAASHSSEGFSLYPNPARDEITLEIEEPANGTGFYSLYTSDGKVISHHRFGDSGSLRVGIDISGLPSGSYILGVYKNGIRTARSFIKN
jgi:hypothetical protein